MVRVTMEAGYVAPRAGTAASLVIEMCLVDVSAIYANYNEIHRHRLNKAYISEK